MRSHGPRTLDSRRRDTGTIVLDARRGVRARPWGTQPEMAHLVAADHTWPPPPADVGAWIDTLAAAGYRTVRTGAVTPAVADVFIRGGFRVEQTLVLLRADPCDRRPRSRRAAPTIRTRRLDADLRDLADIDRAAFGPQWGIDEAGIVDACTATPAHRLRTIEGVAFAVTGRSGNAGFIQRLAVHPSRHGEGLGRALVIDALAWLRRRRLHTAMVNTHTDNIAALGLYESLGFQRLAEPLHVLTRAIGGASS